ncbi:MAG: type II toxin-antitoxin system CcdA family antitoxin [Leptolyngbyaceae cyanobacterium]
MTQSTESPSATNPTPSEVSSHPDEKVEVSVSLDSDLLRQIKFLTDDPSKVIEVAVRQWLRGGARRDDDLTRNLERNPPVPTRGEWND